MSEEIKTRSNLDALKKSIGASGELNSFFTVDFPLILLRVLNSISFEKI